MTDDLRIDKEPTSVSLLTVGGEKLSGQVFVYPFYPLRGGREQPIDIMNAPGEYFPLQTKEGIVLVSKSAIAELDYAAVDDALEDGSLPVGVRVTLSVTMAGGKAYSGAVWVEGPVNTPRLLDFMNRASAQDQRFLVLHAKSRVRLLNKKHIETIRTTD